MGWEPVLYKGKSFDLNNQIISWLQKFAEVYLLSFNHPEWFVEILNDLHGNFHVPQGKYFFDEGIIGGDRERFNYSIKMIDLIIEKMEGMSKRDFFEYIKDELKDAWCDISDANFYNEQWLKDEENFKKLYVGSFRRLKDLMLQDV